MGEVVVFRKKKITGFIPDDLGVAETEIQNRVRGWLGVASLIDFAKSGAPPIADHSFTPDDCA